MVRSALVLCSILAIAAAGPTPDELVDNFLNLINTYDPIEDGRLDVPDLIRKQGYPAEAHTVVTEDGYILQAHRIPHGRDNNNQPSANKRVVFLMHGLLSSSADFVVLGPSSGLAYLLAEEGYDVWMGNARGNTYSDRHVTLDANAEDNVDFWRFSWDDIGNKDLPAFLDYITAVTGQARMHYIGHSQGTTTFFVLNSLRPAYNGKFMSFHGMAPAAFLVHSENEMYERVAQYERLIVTGLDALGIGGVMRRPAWVANLARFCRDGSFLQPTCVRLLFGENSENFNPTIFPTILGHTPAGSSIRQFAHFCQNYNDDRFRRYDYGTFTNLATYGRLTPPDYELSRITVPSYLYHGMADEQVHFGDLQLLASSLGNLQETIIVERPTFNHYDFIWGGQAKAEVYDRIIALLKDAEQRFN